MTLKEQHKISGVELAVKSGYGSTGLLPWDKDIKEYKVHPRPPVSWVIIVPNCHAQVASFTENHTEGVNNAIQASYVFYY